MTMTRISAAARWLGQRHGCLLQGVPCDACWQEADSFLAALPRPVAPSTASATDVAYCPPGTCPCCDARRDRSVALPSPSVVAWMTEGRLPHKHKEKTHLTDNPRIAECWRNNGMFVWPLVRLDPPAPASSSIEPYLCDCARCLELRRPAPHPVPPHTPGWNPVDAEEPPR